MGICDMRFDMDLGKPMMDKRSVDNTATKVASHA